LATSGAKVLFICFNDALGRFLQVDMRTQPNVHVRTIYGLMHRLVGDAGLNAELKALRTASRNDAAFFAALPDLFEQACSLLLEQASLPQYDALIVDEAQDVLSTPLMNALDLVTAGGLKRGRWSIFLDSGLQSGVYQRADQAVLEHLRSFSPATVLLKENFRNPKNVVVETCTVTGARMPICRRILNANVDYRICKDSADRLRKLRALLVDLIRQGIAPRDITILSGASLETSSASSIANDQGLAIDLKPSFEDGIGTDKVTASTISAFKGLENEIIILTDLPALDSTWAKAIYYVGMTRARTMLYALVDDSFINARPV
jgi:hypothetical protein